MFEMLVRTVDHSARSGLPIALLMPRDRLACAPVGVPLSSAEACSLSHELDGLCTPRSRAYSMLIEALHAVGGYIAAIVVDAGPDGEPSAQLQIGLPRSIAVHQAAPADALGLAIRASLSVFVSERVVRAGSYRPRPSTDAASDAAHDHLSDHAGASVPAPFRHALDD
ncbi:MAG: bifunctional nuclease family protein [Chloroflexi bacterium]|nr:bifunctional nuclease family protein [Chloroflexota bacterium]